MAIEIRKAERAKSKLRLGLAGPSGSGKTMSALKLAKGIIGQTGKIILIDTERGSGDLYANLFDYDIIAIEPPYKPEKYVEAIKAAETAGYSIIIIDSLSHAWSDEGGLLDQADKMSNKPGGNRYTVWGDLTPQHRNLVNAMLNSKAHVIGTMRSKVSYEMEEYTDRNNNKKTKPVKIGLAPIQREGMEYEFTVMMDIDQSHNATASKDRTSMFNNEIFVIDETIGKRLADWLNTGVDRELRDKKLKIMHLMKLLGYQDGVDSKVFVQQNVGLELIESNFEEIVGRMEVRIMELREDAANKLKSLGGSPLLADTANISIIPSTA